MAKLEFNCFCNTNNNILPYNILNEGFMSNLEERLAQENYINKEIFEQVVDRLLKYFYQSRAEYEVIITSWPPMIAVQELVRLNEELSQREFKPYRVVPNLDTTLKVDFYDQVKLNWRLFINYLWENLYGTK